MKKLLLFILFVCCFHFAMAQFPPGGNNNTTPAPQGIGRISGLVTDSVNAEPVQYATVALTNIVTGKLIDGTVTDEKGKFEFTRVPVGSYKISINFISYKAIEKTSIVISEQEDVVRLGNILMASDTKQLKEVVIEGQKVLIEEKVDRTVYNAENDATAKGGDATDVLKRVPMLTVDLDGNVSLRGSQNIKILINNRPSTLSAGSVADALKQIPADLIKSVEVITSPSAKYDAEGSAGIININLKKNTLEGVFLNVDGSIGLRASNLGLNGNYNKKKMRFSLGGFGRAGYNIPGSFKSTQTTKNTDGTLTNTIQKADTRTEMVFGNYNLGWDYDIDEHNFITASARYGIRNNHSYQDDLNTQTSHEDTLKSTTDRNVDVSDLSGTLDLSLNYTHTFKKPQRELSLLTLYSQNDRNNNFTNDILNHADLSPTGSTLTNKNPSTNREMSFQADYQTPVRKNDLLEFGAKDIIRIVNSDYSYFTNTGSGENLIGNLSNSFNYNQNVAAGYLSYTYNFLKVYSLKAGGRYEHTAISADYKNGETIAIPSYGVFVESINFSRKFKNGKMLKAAFNRRIQRPSIQFLNPNIQASNPSNITVGNPTLDPEYTNNYELSYSTNVKSSFFTFATFMRNTTGSIQSVRTPLENGVIQTTYQNIGQQDAYGMNIFANINISNKFSLNGGPDFYYAVLNNNDPTNPLNNFGWVVSGRIFGNYNFSNGWGLQMFAFYRGNQVQLQGYQTGFGIYSLSIKKDFNDKKGSIGFGAENFFTPTITVHNELKSPPAVTQSSQNVMHLMSFKVNFSYKIGKAGAFVKKTKSINNDDMKEGGDNNPGGGGMMQGGGSGAPQGGGAPGGTGGPPAGFKPGSGNIPPGFKPGDVPPGAKPGNISPGEKPGEQKEPKKEEPVDENKDKEKPKEQPKKPD